MKRSLVMLAIVPLIASACTLRYTHARFDDQALTNQTKGVPLQGGLVFLGRNHPIGRTDFQLLGGRQEFSSAPQTVLYNVELSFRYFPVRGSL